MQRLILVFLLLFISSINLALAQKNQGQAFYLRAHQFYKNKDLANALKWMDKAIVADPSMAIAYADKGWWLYEQHQYKAAFATYQMAAGRTKNGSQRYALPMTKCALAHYDAATALGIIAQYGIQNKEWQKLKEQAHFIKAHFKANTKDSVKKLSIRINSDDPERFPILTADGQKLIFTGKPKNWNDALFIAHWDSCTNDWFSAKPFPYPINTPLQNAAATISADEHYLFFMRGDNHGTAGWDNGEYDLYMSYTPDTAWSVPQSFGGTINTAGFDGMPCLSPDNKSLFFSSDKAGGLGGKDLYVSFFKEGKWQRPINLGKNINTNGNETSPFLSPDNQTLFFVSDGRAGFGGMDIYRARKINDSSFSEAENIGYPFNTTGNEMSMSVAGDARRAFISSDREGPDGQYDIYETILTERMQPDAVTYVLGYTFDSLTGERLSLGNLHLTNLRTGKEEFHFVSNRGDGSFMMSLPLHEKFLLSSDRFAYETREDTVQLTEVRLAEPYMMPIALLPNGYVPPRYEHEAATLHFKKNEALLNSELETVLAEMLEKRGSDSTAIWVVNSYTDDSGTPMLNEQLSTQRAQLVADFMVSKGIARENINAVGWGEASPLVPNDTDENRDLNRRIEIIMRSLHP